MKLRKILVGTWFVVFVVLLLYSGWQQFQIFRNGVLGENAVNPDQIRHQTKVLAFRPSIFVPYLVLAISAFIDTLFQGGYKYRENPGRFYFLLAIGASFVTYAYWFFVAK
jgi:hypothetical protein